MSPSYIRDSHKSSISSAHCARVKANSVPESRGWAGHELSGLVFEDIVVDQAVGQGLAGGDGTGAEAQWYIYINITFVVEVME